MADPTTSRDVALADALLAAIVALPSWIGLEPLADSAHVGMWPDPIPTSGPRMLVRAPLLAATASSADSVQWATKTTVEIHLPLIWRDSLIVLGNLRDEMIRIRLPGVRLIKADLVEMQQGKYSSLSASAGDTQAEAWTSRWRTASAVAHAAKIDLSLFLVN